VNISRINTPITKVLTEEYIRIYCREREQGTAANLSFGRAKFILQEFIIQYMVENPKRISEINTAYENIKADDSLRERAQIIYDLSTCEEEIKAKYMPLLMQ
jgi:hypothetical protein